MYLKQLEIQGFKSFPEKVKLEFKKGITAVVGPNGSGKSNVSDSVRWVLGEQKAKSLRGEKMEDIIFAGTETRKPVGMAQVTMTIDNADGKMPIEYDEVTVTRRVFRSGESEYRINGSACRLKDVRELFMDTGIGREGYSIIGQGKIDEILSAKSDDRRRLFEEASGIVKFKNRRQEAFANLEKEKENLLRVTDIISELENRLEPLEKQSVDAKKYLSLKEVLKLAHIDIFKAETRKTNDEESNLNQQKATLSADIKKESETADDIKRNISLRKAEAETGRKRREKINAEIAETQSERERLKGDIRLLGQDIEHIKSERARIENENKNRERKIQGLENETEINNVKKTATEVTLKTEKDRLKELEESFDRISGELSESEETIERYKSDMIEKIKRSTEINGDISRIETMLEQFEQRHSGVNAEKSYAKSRIEADNTHIKVLQKQADINKDESRAINEKLEGIIKTKAETEKINAELRRKSVETERELNAKKSRLSVLSDMEKEHEGFFKSVKSILKLKENGNPSFKGVCGAVAQLIGVEEKYETAVETALGGAMQNIVTEDEDAAKTSIEYLKKYSLGRATFLPLSAVQGKALSSDKETVLKENGVIGVARELISYDKKYEGVINYLLGRVIIMRDLDCAIALARKYKYAYKLVTLDGSLLNVGGVMTGGSKSPKTTNIFGRGREINSLKGEVSALAEDVKRINARLEANAQSVKRAESETTELRLKLQELAAKTEAAENEIKRSRQSLAQSEEKLRLYDLEEEQLLKQKEKADKDISDLKAERADIERQNNELNERLEKYKGSLESERQERDRLLTGISDVKISIKGYEGALEGIRAEIKRFGGEIAELKAEIKQGEEQIRLGVEKTREKSEKTTETEKLLAETDKKESDFNKINDAEAKKIKIAEQEIITLEKSLEQSSEVTSSLKNEIFRLETKAERLAEQRKRLSDMMWEEYELTPMQIMEKPDCDIPQDALFEKEKELKAAIKELGPVNVDAIESYKEVKERFDFLSTQRNDIISAQESLKTIIADLTALMEKQFITQFSLISKNFNETFKEMFGGGMAYLKLSDEQNALESGIEIIARPPGKKLQSMTLLSGGERALTAIAILFSILKMKPSPFCILDEIEAALDDANVRRYAKYLEKFSSETQFIVITHRKGTMESADALYGITMQEKGVSKLVSVDFTDGDERQYI